MKEIIEAKKYLKKMIDEMEVDENFIIEFKNDIIKDLKKEKEILLQLLKEANKTNSHISILHTREDKHYNPEILTQYMIENCIILLMCNPLVGLFCQNNSRIINKKIYELCSIKDDTDNYYWNNFFEKNKKYIYEKFNHFKDYTEFAEWIHSE